MAKSYVTQFTEYVSKQQDNLRNKLKSKGLSPSPNATLGSLVSDLDGLQESFGVEKYERDPNFPNIDTMFDNDPLRAVNGGQYKGCVYQILQIDNDGNIGIYYSSSQQYHAPLEKVVIGDGTEYNSQTESFVHKVEENGIIHGSNGFEYCLVKYYATDVPEKVASIIMIQNGTKELINDYMVAINGSTVNAVSVTGYNAPSNNTLEYLRFVFSNTTKEWLQTNDTNAHKFGAVTSSQKYSLMGLKCLRIDGITKIETFNIGSSPLQKIIFNAEIVGISTTATTCKVAFGTYSTTYNYGFWRMPIAYFKTPYSELPLTVSFMPTIKELFITDNVSSVNLNVSTGNNVYPILEKLHIGNGITSTVLDFQYCYNLKEITVSPNAFGLNTTAITVDFSKSTEISRRSILNMFNNFADRTGMTANILKLSTFTKSLVTDEEKAILTNKNWTLS